MALQSPTRGKFVKRKLAMSVLQCAGLCQSPEVISCEHKKPIAVTTSHRAALLAVGRELLQDCNEKLFKSLG